MKKIVIAAFTVGLILIIGCGEKQVKTPTEIPIIQSALQPYREQALEIVRLSLMHEDALLRNHAVEVVALTKTKEMMPIVMKLTKDPMVPVRFAAAMAMGDVRYTAAEYALKRMLKDEDENVRIAAAYSLMKLGIGSYQDKPLAALASKNQTICANAALLIGKSGDKTAIGALYKMINDQKTSDMARIQAAESLAMLGDERMYQGLWAMLISKYADDRIMGIRGMGAIGTLDAKNAIMTLLYHDEENPGDEILEVRLCAAEQLARLGSKYGKGEVVDYFRSVSHSINVLPPNRANQFAIMAIGRINIAELNGYLPNLLANPNKSMQLVAAQSLLFVVR